MTDKVKKFFSFRTEQKKKKNIQGNQFFMFVLKSSSLNRWLNKTWKDKFDKQKNSEEIGST